MAHRIKGTKQITFTVNVIGTLWSGASATYSYQFFTLVGETAIRAKAGDFQSIEDYEIVRVTSGGDWNHSWTRRKVVRDWQHEANADVFAQSAVR